jgi:hypothetical protein
MIDIGWNTSWSIVPNVRPKRAPGTMRVRFVQPFADSPSADLKISPHRRTWIVTIRATGKVVRRDAVYYSRREAVEAVERLMAIPVPWGEPGTPRFARALSKHKHDVARATATMNRAHLSWPLIEDALREARQRLRDAEWHGQDTTAAASDVRRLEMEQLAGVRYARPF